MNLEKEAEKYVSGGEAFSPRQTAKHDPACDLTGRSRRQIHLEFGPLDTKEQVQTYLQEQMGFPAYYGKNLDALYDCLTEYPEDVAVRLTDMWQERPVDEYIRRVFRVFCDAAEENGHLVVTCG
ncbi:MAG: barstar family protein [Lachnospiraceae bacterium]|nr:barstar family protein [Lachnospiraceae bacterium]